MTPQELKNSILQMAIQGKLVEQRLEEGTAEELYQQIQEEKQRLIKAGKIKKEKLLPEITEGEKPFKIPTNWIWTRFGELGSYKKGPFGSALTKSMFVAKGNDTVKVYEQKNAIQKNAKLGEYYITKEYFESRMKGFEVFPGDIIVSCAGTIGETYVLPENLEQGIINQALMRMKLFKPIYIPYFLIFFDFVLKTDARSSSKGSAIKNIPSFDILKNYLVPLPPLAEQRRIVAKIEILLPYIDRYEQAWIRLENFNKSFPDDMKKSILQMAIQGKLVEQRPEDGTAEELYQQIQVEKRQLIKAGKIKNEKPLPRITEKEVPFDIPKSWKWVRLEDIISVLGDGIHGTPEFDNQGEYFFVNGNNLAKGKIIIKSDTKRVSRTEYEKYKKPLDERTILLSINGTIGNYAYYTDEPVILGKSACYFSLINGISKDYICYLLNTKWFSDYAVNKATQTTIKNVSLKAMRMFPIALPPFAEQKRIVAKLEELLPLCKILKRG